MTGPLRLVPQAPGEASRLCAHHLHDQCDGTTWTADADVALCTCPCHRHPSRQGRTMTNAPMPRSRLIALCEELGHNPDRVASILLEGKGITVTYLHGILEDREDRGPVAFRPLVETDEP